MDMTTGTADIKIETLVEFRVVCAHFGKDFHQLHKYPKATERGADQQVIDSNHRAEMDTQGYWYKECAPYRKQERPVTAWTDSE